MCMSYSVFYASLCRKGMLNIFDSSTKLTVFALTQTLLCGLNIAHCLSLIFMLIYIVYRRWRCLRFLIGLGIQFNFLAGVQDTTIILVLFISL